MFNCRYIRYFMDFNYNFDITQDVKIHGRRQNSQFSCHEFVILVERAFVIPYIHLCVLFAARH